MKRALYTFCLTTLLSPAIAHADKVWIGSAGGNALEIPAVTITGIAGGKLRFQSAGREASRDLATVQRIQLDDDPTTTAAENAFAAGKFELATDAYLTALQSTSKSWLKPRLAERLMQAAQQAKRFDAAATGYVAAVMTSDAPASVAKPGMPAAHSTYLATAMAQVKTALADANVTPGQRHALSGFLIDLQRAGGDVQAAAATAQQMLQAGAAKPDADAAADAAIARLKLDAASAALGKKDYAAAMNAIDANRALFSQPKEQAQALFDLAAAQAGMAAAKSDAAAVQTDAAAVKNDAAAWQDAALAYMRVAAHFPDDALTPKALWATAQIEQTKLNDAKAAGLLYQQIVEQYPNDPAAAAAKTMIPATTK